MDTTKNYKNLASSIVLLAIEDTIKAIQGKRPTGINLPLKKINFEEIIQENYRFFKFDWFATISDLDGGRLVKLFEDNKEYIKKNGKIRGFKWEI